MDGVAIIEETEIRSVLCREGVFRCAATADEWALHEM